MLETWTMVLCEKEKNCPYIGDILTYTSDMLWRVWSWPQMQPRVAPQLLLVIIFLKSLNTLEREEIKAVAQQSHLWTKTTSSTSTDDKFFTTRSTFWSHVGNQVQVNQVGIFVEDFLVVLDLLLIMSSIRFGVLIRVSSLFKVLHFILT